MTDNKFPMTPGGFEKIKDELKMLRTVSRPEISRAIAEARELGDLSENAEYHAAREKQSFIEGRISELEDKIARAEVIDIASLSGTTVKFGAIVKLFDELTEEESKYQIVGEYESDLSAGLLSITSPLARALIGKSEGDTIEVFTPKSKKIYEIISVSFS